MSNLWIAVETPLELLVRRALDRAVRPAPVAT
jgi:hypothetical protein